MASLDDSPSKNLPRRGPEGSSSFFEKVGKLQDQSDERQTCYRYRYPGCDKMYVHKKRRNNHEINVHGIRIEDHQPDRTPPNPKDEDGIFYYPRNILKTGPLLRDLQGATKGDGGRMKYLWKVLMLMLKVCGKTKYALAVLLLAV